MNKKNTSRNNRKLKPRLIEFDNVKKSTVEFKIIETKHWKYLFNSALFSTFVVVLIFIFNGWYTHGPVEILYVSGGTALIFYFLFANELFERFPKMLMLLWRRGLLRQPDQNHLNSKSPTKEGPKEELAMKFLQDTRKHFNNRISVLFGFIGSGIGLWLIWLFDQGWIVKIPEFFRSLPLGLSFVLFTRVVFVFAGFIGGMIGWWILIVGMQISVIGKSFELDIDIHDPDDCGGLSKIGDLCLMLVYCTIPFMILTGAWLTFISTLDISYLHMLPTNINELISTLQVFLFPLIAFSILCFFFPLISIHNSMLCVKSALDDRLNINNQKIHLIELELLTKAESLSRDKRISLEENLDFLMRSNSRFQSIPIWPFRTSHLLRLTSSQIIPIVGLISSLMAFFRDITK